MRIPGPALTVVAALSLLASPQAAQAEQVGKIPRIGILANAPSKLWEAFEQRLRELGYLPNQTIVLEYRWSEGNPERFPLLAAELVSRKVDLLVATSEPAARASSQATATIPTVFFVDEDPVAAGLVASLGRPGGNLTGLTVSDRDLFAKRLELLKEVVPRARRVAVLWQAGYRFAAATFKEGQGPADALGLALRPYEVGAPADLEATFAALTRDRSDALVVFASPLPYIHRARIAELAAKAKLPAIYPFREGVEAGALLSYATDLREVWGRAAHYVDRILKGVKPADLPVEQPTRFELLINLKTAKVLGLTIPRAVLLRADQVIE